MHAGVFCLFKTRSGKCSRRWFRFRRERRQAASEKGSSVVVGAVSRCALFFHLLSHPGLSWTGWGRLPLQGSTYHKAERFQALVDPGVVTYCLHRFFSTTPPSVHLYCCEAHSARRQTLGEMGSLLACRVLPLPSSPAADLPHPIPATTRNVLGQLLLQAVTKHGGQHERDETGMR